MDTALGVLSWMASAAFVAVGLLAARDFLQDRTRARGAVAAGLGLLSCATIAARVNELSGYRLRIAFDIAIVAFAASGLALLQYRSTVVRVRRSVAVLAATSLSVTTAWVVAADLPLRPGDPWSGHHRAAAAALAVVWSACVVESTVRFFVRSRREPIVPRRRLRLLASGYCGIVLVLVLSVVAPGSPAGVSAALNLVSVALAPMMYAAVVPPLWLRRRWLASASRRVAMSMASVGSWYWDLAADLVVWSDELCAIFGMHPRHRHLVGGTLDRVHPDDRDDAREVLVRSVRTQEPFGFDHRIARPDGEIRWVHTAGHAVADPATGRTVALYGTSQDITDRKQIEDALATGERRLQETQELARLGSWSWDLESNQFTWSKGMELIAGSEDDRRVEGRSLDDAIGFVHRDDRPRAWRAFSRLLEGAGDAELEFRLVRPDGEERWVCARGTAVRGADGGVVELRGSAQDITDRKADEELLAVRIRQQEAVSHLSRLALEGADPESLFENAGHLVAGTLAVNFATVFRVAEDGDVEGIAEGAGRVSVAIQGAAGTVGLLVVQPHERFGPDDVHFLEAVANVLALAVERESRARDLARSEEQFRALAEAAPDVIYRYRLTGSPGFEYVSPSVVDLTGYAPGELYADPQLYRHVIHPDDRDALDSALASGGSPGAPLVLRCVRKNGEVRWTEQRLVPIHDADGGLVAVQGIARDITESKQSELLLRESEERFRFLVEAAPEAVLVLDELGKVLVANEEAGRLFGSPQAKLLGRQVESLIPLEGLLDEAVPRRSGGRSHLSDLWAVREDRSRVPVEVSVSPIVTEHGVQVIAAILDMTERRKAEQALRQAFEREREASERLRSLDRMKDAFLEAVSHELRTPLTAVLGIAETLSVPKMRLPRPQTEHLLTRLAANARRLDRLLADLLDLDRITRGVLEPKRRPTDVGAVVRQIVGQVEVTTHVIRVDTPSVIVNVSPAQIERIVENLVMNAVRHTPPGTEIWARTRSEAGGALVSIEDDGPGVPDVDKLVLFEPFRRGSSPAARSRGAGIGLALVSRFAELHGGRAWVEDRPGGGAAFRVFLPDRTVQLEIDSRPADASHIAS